jgi:hypothetical protein
MRVSWKSPRTRLQQLLISPYKYELDHGGVGAPTDMQGKIGDRWFIATNRNQSTRHRNNGITDCIRQIYKQRTEIDQLFPHIPSNVLSLRYYEYKG